MNITDLINNKFKNHECIDVFGILYSTGILSYMIDEKDEYKKYQPALLFPGDEILNLLDKIPLSSMVGSDILYKCNAHVEGIVTYTGISMFICKFIHIFSLTITDEYAKKHRVVYNEKLMNMLFELKSQTKITTEQVKCFNKKTLVR